MLTLLRNSIGGWVAKSFILLLVASFGVWGVSGSILGNSGGAVVEVGETEVSANDYVLAYERARYGLARQFGRLLTREEAQLFGIENSVLTQLVSGAVLDDTATNMGLGLSDTNLAGLIGEDTAFQDATGNFNRRVLTQQLQQLGMSEADYVKNRQSVAVRNQLLEGTSSNTQTPQVYIDAYEKYRGEKRVFKYATISPKMLAQPPAPTSDELKAYFDKNKVNYTAPEYRNLILVKLEPSDVSNPDSITAEEILEEYEARKSEFRTDEKRTIQQLSLTDEAQGKLVLERLNGGESFEAIAADLGKSETDINIGEFTLAALPDPNVGKAAFGLELNTVSKIVNGIFGPVILRVTQITPESTKPLSDVEADLRKRLALVKAGEELFDIHDRLEDERASGDTLGEAPRKVNLKIRTLDKIDASGRLESGDLVEDLPESSKLLRQAFESAIGVETDPISIGSSGFVWFEVAEIFVKRQKTYSEVTDDVAKSLSRELEADAVLKVTEQIVAKLEDGDDFNSAFNAVLPDKSELLIVSDSAELGRDDTSDNLTADAVKSGFSVAKEGIVFADGKNSGERIILKITDIDNTTSNPIGPDEKKQLDEAVGGDLLNQMVGDMRERKTVRINESAIRAAQNYIR